MHEMPNVFSVFHNLKKSIFVFHKNTNLTDCEKVGYLLLRRPSKNIFNFAQKVASGVVLSFERHEGFNLWFETTLKETVPQR